MRDFIRKITNISDVGPEQSNVASGSSRSNQRRNHLGLPLLAEEPGSAEEVAEETRKCEKLYKDGIILAVRRLQCENSCLDSTMRTLTIVTKRFTKSTKGHSIGSSIRQTLVLKNG